MQRTTNQFLKEDLIEKILTVYIFMGRFLKLHDDILELCIAVQNVGSYFNVSSSLRKLTAINLEFIISIV